MNIDFLFPHVQQLSQQTNTNWIFIILAVILMVLLAWWVIHSANQTEPGTGKAPLADADASPAARSVETPIIPAVETQPIEPAAEIVPDDLIIVEGIGPKINSILKAAGVVTFKQLAAMEPSEIKAIITQGGIRLADPSTWPEQARLAAEGDFAALKSYQDRLTAGRS